MAALVVLTIRIIVALPVGAERTRVEQGSALGLAVGGTEVKVTSNVGATSGVSVGDDVCVGIWVGGNGVALGSAS